MSDKNFTLDIVTPIKKVFSGSVQSFSAPGVVGGFQTLFNHAPLLSQINVGELKITDETGKTFYYATSIGFVEVNKNKVIVLSDTAERSDEINIDRARESKERAEDRLKNRQTEINSERARASLLRALNRIKVSSR
ncbi:MAG: F0F1 ATP synthase subunit epsilon [Bacteroidota bacterium]